MKNLVFLLRVFIWVLVPFFYQEASFAQRNVRVDTVREIHPLDTLLGKSLDVKTIILDGFSVISFQEGERKCEKIRHLLTHPTRLLGCVIKRESCPEPGDDLRRELKQAWIEEAEKICRKGNCDKRETCQLASKPTIVTWEQENDNACLNTDEKGCYVAAIGVVQCKCE